MSIVGNTPLAVTNSSDDAPHPPKPFVYSIAKLAHSKLTDAAECQDRDLRRLVAHANFYDKCLGEYYYAPPAVTSSSSPTGQEVDSDSDSITSVDSDDDEAGSREEHDLRNDLEESLAWAAVKNWGIDHRISELGTVTVEDGKADKIEHLETVAHVEVAEIEVGEDD